MTTVGRRFPGAFRERLADKPAVIMAGSGEALAEGAGETPPALAHAARAPRCISMPLIASMKLPTMYCGAPTSRSG